MEKTEMQVKGSIKNSLSLMQKSMDLITWHIHLITKL